MPETPRAGCAPLTPASARTQAPQLGQAPPASQPARLVLGFDFGRRRIGVACGDTLSRSAAPLGAIAAGASGPDWAAIDALIGEWQPAVAVVGLPYNVDDSEGVMAASARAFAGELAGRYQLTTDLVDERYSSLEAGARLRDSRQTGVRKRRVSKSDVDSAAACVILERWFTQRQ